MLRACVPVEPVAMTTRAALWYGQLPRRSKRRHMKIYGPPAIDRELRTINFLTLLDLDELPALVKKRLLVQQS